MELNLHSVDAYLDMEIVLIRQISLKCLWSRQTSNEGNLLHLTSSVGPEHCMAVIGIGGISPESNSPM